LKQISSLHWIAKKANRNVMIERIADRVILTFPERIVFDHRSSQLKPSAQTTLDKVASFINERPYLIVESWAYGMTGRSTTPVIIQLGAFCRSA